MVWRRPWADTHVDGDRPNPRLRRLRRRWLEWSARCSSGRRRPANRLALEAGAAGQIYHAVAENAPFRQIAEAIGKQAGLRVRSVTREEADGHFGPLAISAATGTDVPSAMIRDALGWAPAGPGLLSKITRTDYLATDIYRAEARP